MTPYGNRKTIDECNSYLFFEETENSASLNEGARFVSETPPVKEPPNEPKKPPVEEPGDPHEDPPPPGIPPVEEPNDVPPRPPVKEPPPNEPNPGPRKPPIRAVTENLCIKMLSIPHSNTIVACN
jgi:hypothetical protein